ncbi:hypothetical protein BC826DRAFT_977756 [Russula brevipes]|nr:hypothetical protein BC826DRAFT_977756 [Russula brevipes]
MDVTPSSGPTTPASALFSSSSSSSTPHSNVTTQDAASTRRGASHSAQRSYTDTKPSSLKVKKRIIVCCDGTWQDGVVISERWKYTNILRLSRAISHVDERFVPPVPQIVFYQAGVGTESQLHEALLDGEQPMCFCEIAPHVISCRCHRGESWPQLFLFGFSRGAYTARMIAMMIREIGVLDRTDMDYFADIFVDLQARGKSNDKDRIELLDAKLARWTRHNSPGKVRADYDGDSFVIKCIGVFDTVGSLGLPEELAFGSKKIKSLFGFPDSVLGDHVERAYQALALNETRADFNCNKFKLSEEGIKKRQVLKQIGGGYKEHDLSDLTLFWMAANIEDIVSIDTEYLFSLLEPIAPWGTQKPHDPRTGIFALASTIQRHFPTSVDPLTRETIHPSVLMQNEATAAPISSGHSWKGVADVTEAKVVNEDAVVRRRSFIARAVTVLKRRVRGDDHSLQPPSIGILAQRSDRSDSTASVTANQRGWLLRLRQETSLGVFVRDLI